MTENVSGELISFFAGMMGTGGILGFASGYATKKIIRISAFFIGLTFIVIQFLAFKGVITVNWDFLGTVLDGFFKPDNIENGVNSLLKMLTFNLPFAGAFAGGFWIGVKKG